MATYNVKTTVTTSEIQKLLFDYNRGDNFSYYALDEILSYLEEISDNGMIDLDIIGLCCDFTEQSWDSFINKNKNYLDLDEYKDEDGDYNHFEILERLNEETWAVDLGDSILYANF